MVTKALTAFARRANRNHISASKIPGLVRDWREVLISQDTYAIWHSLFDLAQSSTPDEASSHDFMTQELFLFLVATGRKDIYLERGYSNEEIQHDLLSLLSG
jgi:hypothetical protein